jgi:quercetin dioxygenase-like cupin family protein
MMFALLWACQTVAVVEAGDAPVPAVVKAVDRPVHVAPPGTASARPLVAGRNAFVGELWLEPGASVPVHRDATEEYLVVLEGAGTLTIDGTEHQLSAGMSVYMPANAEVSFVNGPERLHAIQVFAGRGPEAKYDAWPVRED